MRTVAGIDLGTQSMKVLIYDFERKENAACVTYPVPLISENDGTREQKVEWYDEALSACFAMIPENIKKTVCAVGVSAHQHSFVPLGGDGKPLCNVKLWNDTSTLDECRLLTDSIGGERAVIREIKNLMLPGFTAPKIFHLKRRRPELFAKLRYIMLPHDYLNFRLTGSYAAEYGDASGTALFNCETREWSPSVCDRIDGTLKSLLPPLISSEQSVGRVSVLASVKLGIPEGIPVSSGGGDNMCGAIGTGTVSDGFLTMSMGTSGTLYGYSEKPVCDPVNGVSGFCSSTGGWLPLVCTMNCTVVTENVRGLLGLTVEELDGLASSAEIGGDGVVVLPFFNGERTPNLPHGCASITGLTAANSSRENVCRAAMESAVFALRGGLDSFRRLGFEPKEIRLTGGGAKSTLWRQIVASVFDLPVKIPVSEEGAALGAAIQALWCYETMNGRNSGVEALCAEHVRIDTARTAEPIPEQVQKYAVAYDIYRRFVCRFTKD